MTSKEHTMSRPTQPIRRIRALTGGALAALLLVTGCTSNTPETDSSDGDGGNSANAASSNDETGETVTIGFSGPAADHGWLAAINSAALEEAEKFDDVELRAAEGTND